MRVSTKIALLFVAIWFSGKMLFFKFQLFQTPDEYLWQVFWNILCLLLAMALGSMLEKRKEDRSQSTALGDIKSILSGGLVYTILTATLLLTYYSKIDPGYNKHQVEVAEAKIKETLDDPKGLKEIRNSRPEFATMSKEELYNNLVQNPRSFFSYKTVFVMSLLGMLMLSMLNAIVLTIVYRRLIFRN